MEPLILFAFIIVLILIDFAVVVMSLRYKSKELHYFAPVSWQRCIALRGLDDAADRDIRRYYSRVSLDYK